MGPPRRLAAISGHVVVAPSAASGAIRRSLARLARGLADALDSAPDEAPPADEVAAAGASSSEPPVRVALDDLADFISSAFELAGMPAETAAEVGRTVAETEAWRQSTHGLAQLTDGLATLNSADGIFEAAATPRIASEAPATASIDGCRCLGNRKRFAPGVFQRGRLTQPSLPTGQVAMALAKRIGKEKARANGVALVHVYNTGWVGALGNPLVELSEEGFLCHAWCRSPSSAEGKPPLDAAPYGGRESRLGTSPMALSFPAQSEGESGTVMSDFSTAVMAFSKVKAMAAAVRAAFRPSTTFLVAVHVPD